VSVALIHKPVLAAAIVLGAFIGAAAIFAAGSPVAAPKDGACDKAGLSLPPGFCATVFADNIGHARHLVVAPDGTVYVNSWSGEFYPGSPPPPGGFIVGLRDSDGDGKADRIERFGETEADRAAGGVGIAFYRNSIYAELNDRIVRYPLGANGVLPPHPAEMILSDLPLSGDHPMHPFVIDKAGNLFVNMGSATNACDIRNRVPNGLGHRPCTEQATRGGVWRYDANKAGQRFSPAERYATGIRNTGGLSFDEAGRLFAVQHGRDQLAQNWPRFYTVSQGAELPAEELLLLFRGADFGWPSCYYDGFRKRLMLAPEYGGDGKAVGPCAGKQGPVAAFPAHWAPVDLLIYRGNQFPAAYRGGAFIAFHGSWNRAPEPQQGYNIVFQPLKDSRASGNYIVFADGFAGGRLDPSEAAFRPSGLAMAPDGALYVADDQHGRIWRITYRGPPGTPLAGVSSSLVETAAANDRDVPLTPPPGYTRAQLALGERIFHGQERSGTCSGCHGGNAAGSSAGPSLITGTWLWGDGSVGAIARTIETGVARPRRSAGAMPPKGGAPLSKSDVQAVAAYVWALNHMRK
jgi:glucose/arabinose dehydrogenase/cytochrome c5